MVRPGKKSPNGMGKGKDILPWAGQQINPGWEKKKKLTRGPLFRGRRDLIK